MIQSNIIYTFPFSYPQFPKGRPEISALSPSPHGTLGVAIAPIRHDSDTPEIPCYFFSIDPAYRNVQQFEMIMPYFDIFQLQVVYDQTKKTWTADHTRLLNNHRQKIGSILC